MREPLIFHLTKTDHQREKKDYRIRQGATLQLFTIGVNGDISDWIVDGQVRTLPVDDPDSEVLANWSVAAQYFDEEENRTYIVPFLPANETINITKPPKERPSFSKEEPIPGIHVWIYDVFARHPTDARFVIKLIEGYAEVSLRATEL